MLPALGKPLVVRIMARFEDYTGIYMYHCHFLEHEEMSEKELEELRRLLESTLDRMGIDFER